MKSRVLKTRHTLWNLAYSRRTTHASVYVFRLETIEFAMQTYFCNFSDPLSVELEQTQEYLHSPYLTIDSESLGSHFRDQNLSGQSMNTSDNVLADGKEMQRDSVTCDIPKHNRDRSRIFKWVGRGGL